MREAHRERIATAFYLANATYRDSPPFEDAGAIFTPSRALAAYYRETVASIPDQGNRIGIACGR